MAKWKPIWTAPKGVRVLLFEPPDEMFVGNWYGDQAPERKENPEIRAQGATHWMPLPEPPHG